jgi:phosphoribosylformylglycinamidine cyclo-ligase
VVDRERIFNRENVTAGDVLIGLKSNGLHTNGYSLARRALLSRYTLDSQPAILSGETLADALLKVHRSYLRPIQHLLEKFSSVTDIHALSHITGGGIVGNTSRVLPDGLSLDINWNSWPRPHIFRLIQETAMIPEVDMRRTFNLGIGLILIVSNDIADNVESTLREFGEEPVRIGNVVHK